MRKNKKEEKVYNGLFEIRQPRTFTKLHRNHSNNGEMKKTK